MIIRSLILTGAIIIASTITTQAQTHFSWENGLGPSRTITSYNNSMGVGPRPTPFTFTKQLKQDQELRIVREGNCTLIVLDLYAYLHVVEYTNGVQTSEREENRRFQHRIVLSQFCGFTIQRTTNGHND